MRASDVYEEPKGHDVVKFLPNKEFCKKPWQWVWTSQDGRTSWWKEDHRRGGYRIQSEDVEILAKLASWSFAKKVAHWLDDRRTVYQIPRNKAEFALTRIGARKYKNPKRVASGKSAGAENLAIWKRSGLRLGDI